MIHQFPKLLIILWMGSISYTVNGEEQDPKIILDNLIKEVQSDELLKNHLTFENQNDEIIVNGQLEQLIDFDNNFKVKVEIYRAQEKDSEYKIMMSLPAKGVCDYMKSYYASYFYETLKNHANAPVPDKCPVTKDTYEVKDYPVDTKKFKKFLKIGYYRIIVTLSKDDEVKIKYIVECHVEK